MQIYSKPTKNATSLFLRRCWFCLVFLMGLVGASKLLHRILKFINYANLCKFIQNQKKNATPLIDLMHWRHVSITTTPCWGSRLVALRAHVLLAERIGAHPLSQCAHPGQLGGEACRGLPSDCMLGDGARGVPRLTPNTTGAPFCDVICIWSISWAILILFASSDRAWWGLRNFYTELWNSLFMQIYSKSMKNSTSPLFRNHNRSALPAGTYITHRVIYYPLVLHNSSFPSIWTPPLANFHSKGDAPSINPPNSNPW